MNFQDINLAANPFKSVTPNPNNINIWAGMPTQKERIGKVYSDAFSRDIGRQLVLNWGPIGGGKTYAAFYFMKKGLEELELEQNQGIHAYIKLPKEGKNASIESIKAIFDRITVETIVDLIGEAATALGGKEALAESLKYGVNSSEILIETLLSLSLPPSSGNLGFGSKSQLKTNLQRYIHGAFSSSDLRKLNLIKPLKTISDYIQFLSLTLIAITANPNKKRVIFIWVDEMEDMLYFSGKEFKQYSQTIRDLIDAVPQDMATFLNFTLTEGDNESVKMLLGEALWSRVENRNIRFRDLTVEDALEYCTDLINYELIDKEKESPIKDAAMKYVLERLTKKDLIPREINKRFNELFDFALTNERIPITIDVVKEWHLDIKETEL